MSSPLNSMIPEPVASPRTRRSGLVITVIALIVVAGAAGSWWLRSENTASVGISAGAPQLDPRGMAPAGQRVRVRVVNTTKSRGLARRASDFVRDLGFDVVDYDSDSKLQDQTTVVSHTGHRDWAERLARGVKADTIVTRAESTLHYVDLTLLIGSNWKPPAKAFRP